MRQEIGEIKMITTTLNLLKENEARISGYEKLFKHVGIDFDKDEKIPLTTILKPNDLSDTLWVLDNSPCEEEDAKILQMYFGSWCAKQVVHLYEKEFPNDNRVRDCIETIERFVKGEANQEEVDAARDAAAYAAQENKLKEMLEGTGK